MIRRGKYIEFQKKLYKLVVSDDEYTLVSDNESAKDIGFTEYSRGGKTVYVKDMSKKDLLNTNNIKIYDITPMVKYRDLLFPVKLETDNEFVIGTSNTELANKYDFFRTDKYFYEKTVLKSESELLEEFQELELK